MEITTYRVKQYSSKMIFVVCVEGIPFCTVRGKNALNRIIQRLNGIDVQFEDKRIEFECDKLIKELRAFKTNDGEMFIIPKEFEEEIRADERAKCETCIHKVTKADIDAIENTAKEKALDELENKIAYEYYDGGYGDYHEVEMIVRMIHEMKAKKEQE